MYKFSGFTLAEVLITLGIIGVVAAMTIPVLIANTRSAKYRSQFKKTVSTLSQAARLSDSLYGFDYGGITQVCGNNAAEEHPDTRMSICALLNGTLTGATYYERVTELKVRKNSTFENYSIIKGDFMNGDSSRQIGNFRAYVLSDGTIVAIYKDLGVASCSLPIGSSMYDVATNMGQNMQHCVGFIDVNGTILPNKEVTCSSGTNSLTKNDCVVKNDAQHMTDVYPIRFHDGVVEPASAAAKCVLRTAK